MAIAALSNDEGVQENGVSAQPWWQRGAIYQLLVPSFLDTDNDGLGDLAGITARLDYLEWLGVNAIWFSPCYPSPLKELGYDVSDYCERRAAIRLARSLRPLARGSARARPPRDPRLGRQPHVGAASVVSRVALEPQQRAPQLVPLARRRTRRLAAEQLGQRVRRQRLAMGRRDLAVLSAHVLGVAAGPQLARAGGARGDARCHEVLARSRASTAFASMRRRCSSKTSSGATIPSIRTTSAATCPIARCCRCTRAINRACTSCSRSCARSSIATPATACCSASSTCRSRSSSSFYGTRAPELHLPLNLTLTYSKWEPSVIGRTIAEYQGRVSAAAVGRRRRSTRTISSASSTRAGLPQARVAAMLLLTQRGTPTVYYGDEIGMRGVTIPPEQAVDPQGRRTGRNRDPTRTPMQWSNEPQAGFSSVEPWLPVGARPRRRERRKPEPRCGLAADAVPAPARATRRRARVAGRCARAAHRRPGSRRVSADAAPRGGCSSC